MSGFTPLRSEPTVSQEALYKYALERILRLNSTDADVNDIARKALGK